MTRVLPGAVNGKMIGLEDVSNPGTIVFEIGSGSAVIGTGFVGYIPLDFAYEIVEVELYADQSGSMVLDLWKDSYANYPPTVADTICAAAKPTLSAATKATDSTLTGWTTSVAAGEGLGVNVDSCSTITQAWLKIKYNRS